jgi:hypothetical protein
MAAAVKLREDFSAQELRALARRAKDVNQSRRLLSLAAVRDGKDRAEARPIKKLRSDAKGASARPFAAHADRSLVPSALVRKCLSQNLRS